VTASQLGHLKAWDGEWKTKSYPPDAPRHGGARPDHRGVAEGEKFLLQRARHGHRDFSDSISVIGDTEEGADSLTMH
jgi:hypothetical protein